MSTCQRVFRLREELNRAGVDALIVERVSDLRWLTGFSNVFDGEQAHLAVVSGDCCVIHTDSRYSTAMRTAASHEGLWEVDDEPQPHAAFVARVLEEVGLSGGVVAFDPSMSVKAYRALRQALSGVELVERCDEVLRLRSVKDPQEVKALQAAQALAEEAFLATLEKLQVGMTEAEVSLLLEMEIRGRGAQELAFPNIVASGPNSANPHAVAGSRPLSLGDMVVFDFGACLDGYRSDTTRTVCLGQPSSQQLQLHQALRQANEAVQAQLRAGVVGSDMHKLAEEVLAQAGYANRMGHGLGHGVGIDIHELPNLNTRNDEPLPSGAVVTVEPGIYLPGEFGGRLEDFGLVTDSGFMNFCTLGHELMVIE